MTPLWQARYEVARGIGLIPAGEDAPWPITEMLDVIRKEISPGSRGFYYEYAARRMAEILERHSPQAGRE